MTLVDLPDYHRRGTCAHVSAALSALPRNESRFGGQRRIVNWSTTRFSPRGTMEINITDDTRPVHAYFITIILLDLLSCNVIQIAENVEIYLGKKYATTV